MSKMRTSTRYAGGRGSNTKPPRMVMRRHWNNRTYVFYRSPLVIEHTNIGQNWTEVERVGREALLRRTSQKTHTFSVSTTLGSNDIYEEVSADLKELDACARALGEFTINYSSRESGVFNMTDFSYTVTRRSPRTNEPTRADVTMTFRRAVKATIKTGQVSKPAPKPKPKKKSNSNLGTYTVKKGDTLWAIAGRYYNGRNHLWPKIADANGVKNPRLLQIGKKLKIPRV